MRVPYRAAPAACASDGCLLQGAFWALSAVSRAALGPWGGVVRVRQLQNACWAPGGLYPGCARPREAEELAAG